MALNRHLLAALSTGLALLAFAPCTRAQDAAPPPQQPAAPIVRPVPRPRPVPPLQNSVPPEAAPLVHRPSAPRPASAAQGTSAAVPKVASTPAGANTTPAETPHKAASASASSSSFNRNVIVLDPAHGGNDSGARIGDSTLEKDVALALAYRLRALLTARGFTVILTRDSGAAAGTPGTPLTLDERAGIANRARASACVLLHATGRGTGVHLYSSELAPTSGEPALVPWLSAQSAWVPASAALKQQIGAALGRSHITLVSSTASVRPVDSLTCPALVLELAPETDTPTSVNSPDYQDRVANAVAGALVFWQNQAQPPARLTTPAPVHTPVKHPKPAATEPEPQP